MEIDELRKIPIPKNKLFKPKTIGDFIDLFKEETLEIQEHIVMALELSLQMKPFGKRGKSLFLIKTLKSIINKKGQ